MALGLNFSNSGLGLRFNKDLPQPVPTQRFGGFQSNINAVNANPLANVSAFDQARMAQGGYTSPDQIQRSGAEKNTLISRAFNQAQPTITTGADGVQTATKSIQSPYNTNNGVRAGQNISYSWVLPKDAMNFRFSQSNAPLTDAQRGASWRFGGSYANNRVEVPKERMTNNAFQLPTDRFGNPMINGVTDYRTGEQAIGSRTYSPSALMYTTTNPQYQRFRGLNPNFNIDSTPKIDYNKVGDYAYGKQFQKEQQLQKKKQEEQEKYNRMMEVLKSVPQLLQ